MRPLGPLVPGIDEQQSLVPAEKAAQPFQLLLNIGLEGFGRRADKAVAAQRLPRRVIPVREHRRVSLVTRQRTTEVPQQRALVVELRADEPVADNRRLFSYRDGVALRRELDGGVEAKLARR